MTIDKHSSWRNYTIYGIAIVMVLAGLYMLCTAMYPLVHFGLINQANSSTTRLIEQTAGEITDNRLYIPKIDINLPYSTGDARTMENGAWWRVPENGNPEDGGNFVLSAHRFIMGITPEQTLRKSPFYNIDKLAVDDQIIIDYSGRRYTYKISQIFSVKPEAIEIENRTDEPQLTLYSCTLGGASDGREVIIAKPVTK